VAVTRAFYSCILLGILAVIVAAAFLPLPVNTRYRSIIGVVPDGGREEAFIIQWPQDRIGPGVTPPGLATGDGVALMSTAAGSASVELFRLRDVSGNVIGLASRSTYRRSAPGGGGVQASDWMLFIPSRGTLHLQQENAIDIAAAADAGGAVTAAADRVGFWSAGPQVSITTDADRGGGRVMGGAEEFAGFTGRYDEAWSVEGEPADGRSSGRITINTRTVLEGG